MDGFPGVRNYGVVDPDDLYDVYCYAEELNGDWGWEVLRGRDPSPGLPLGPPGPLLDLSHTVFKCAARSKGNSVPLSKHCHRDRFTAEASRQAAERGG